LADGIVLERAGIPAVSICTDAFRASAGAMAKVMGFPGFEYVAVPHPVASRTEKEIAEMVHEAMPQIVRILGGASETGAAGEQGSQEEQ
jgi:hypothetical protein